MKYCTISGMTFYIGITQASILMHTVHHDLINIYIQTTHYALTNPLQSTHFGLLQLVFFFLSRGAHDTTFFLPRSFHQPTIKVWSVASLRVHFVRARLRWDFCRLGPAYTNCSAVISSRRDKKGTPSMVLFFQLLISIFGQSY